MIDTKLYILAQCQRREAAKAPRSKRATTATKSGSDIIRACGKHKADMFSTIKETHKAGRIRVTQVSGAR